MTHNNQRGNMENEFRHFVGIDWAMEEHQVCVIDGKRKVVDERVVKHTGTAIAELATWLGTLGDPKSIAVAIETPHGAVVEMLMERGFTVFHLNPKQLDRFRDRHRVSGVKNDRLDAFVLADALRTDQPSFHQVVMAEDDVQLLRELVRADDELVKEANGLANRLREQLLRFFPQVLELCPSLDEPWVWALLELLPTPDSAAKAKESAVAKLLSYHRIRRIGAREVLATLGKPPLRVGAGTVLAASARIRLLLPRLKLVSEQRRAVEKDVKQLLQKLAEKEPSEGQVCEHRDVTILLSLPGVGWKVTATMLAEADEALAARDYSALRALAGVAPVTKQTGKNKKGRPEMRRAANSRLRNAHYHWARVAAQTDPHAKAQYAALRSKGHSHGRSLRGVADRNLRVLMAMLRGGTLYDPTRPVKANNAGG